MSRPQPTAQSSRSKNRADQLSRDVVLEVLSNERRRYVVHYLKRHDGRTVPLGDVAEHVASWELDKPVAALNYRERKRVRNALQQFHLPKMEERGFVEYEERDGRVGLSPAASDEEFYLDILSNREVPWGAYYLGVSGFGLVCLGGVLFGAAPFASLTPLALFAGFTAVLTVSSLGHFYDNYYRMRLGAGETPPGVDEP